ncbi:MBL fold metallo-hydrolase [Crenalkalicoccus roseus]|uniref:MBL fold metallo-hydrolase n=1 Tax=Crenalkalicoccus roseus TaxID=1485588 RepID=UPI001080FCDC|nr:MBL fold metallo-hydrolase [Crenalkalicoccus roseus]
MHEPVRRRAAFAGLSAATAAALGMPGLIGRAARAQAPAAPAQAPGFHRFRLGGFTVTMVHDGARPQPLDGFVQNAPIEEVRQVLAESFLPTDRLRIPFTALVVDTGRNLVLMDTGNGPQQQQDATVGLLQRNLSAAGIDPARVDTVLISHFHGDHINGLLDAQGGRAFPEAEIVVPEAEWRWWTDAGNEGRSPERQRPTFANTARRFAPYQGRVRQIGDGAEAVPGIRAVAAHGHTPGHTAFHVADGGAEMIYVADTTNRPELLARRPGFHIVFDFDPAAAEATRRRLYDRIATDRIRLAGFHFPFPAHGYLAKEGDGYRFVPADWSEAV